MPATQFPDPWNLPLQGIVDANGVLDIPFGPPLNEKWAVTQITAQMRNAPVGATLDILYLSLLFAPGLSARKAAFGGEPPLSLKGGEQGHVRWENATPNDIGTALIVYMKSLY